MSPAYWWKNEQHWEKSSIKAFLIDFFSRQKNSQSHLGGSISGKEKRKRQKAHQSGARDAEHKGFQSGKVLSSSSFEDVKKLFSLIWISQQSFRLCRSFPNRKSFPNTFSNPQSNYDPKWNFRLTSHVDNVERIEFFFLAIDLEASENICTILVRLTPPLLSISFSSFNRRS
jgi:hypothetical protein